MSGLVETFESSLGGMATLHVCSVSNFESTVSEAIQTPAVGTPLQHSGVTLEQTDVTVELTPERLEKANTGVTPATHAIANYGTVTVPSDAAGSELVSLYTDRHVAVVAASDIVSDMPEAYAALATDFGDGQQTQVLATGPSATADMGTLVHGVHGPNEVHIIILEDR